MTGYGRAKKTLSNRDITVEVRSVNNRYLDCTVKLPRAYIFAEDAIKGRVQKAISRGKVDVFVTIDSTGADEEVVVVNEGLARSYLEALRKLYEIDGGNYLQKQSYAADLARIPDVLTVTKAEEDLESVGADICEVLDEALASYNQMRATEGKKLAEDIGGRLTTIETLTGKVEERSPETVREYREKLTARMQEVLQSTTIDESRILTEAAIFADKTAVDEETVRLRSHIAQDRASALARVAATRHAALRRTHGPQDGLPHSGGQPREQHHRLEVQRCRHRARCGRAQGGGRKDPRAGAEHRVRGEANEAAEHRIWQHGVRRAPDRRRQP